MKICKNCNTEKPLDQFASKGRRVSGKQRFKGVCKDCENTRLRKFRLENKKPRNKDTTAKESVALWFIKLKQTLSCVDCTLSFQDHPFLCDFHHLDPTTKLFHLGGAHKNHTKEAILAELGKCIPLCANCHRKRHYTSRPPVLL